MRHAGWGRRPERTKVHWQWSWLSLSSFLSPVNHQPDSCSSSWDTTTTTANRYFCLQLLTLGHNTFLLFTCSDVCRSHHLVNAQQVRPVRLIQSLCAVCGSNLAGLTLLYSAALRGGCCFPPCVANVGTVWLRGLTAIVINEDYYYYYY